MSGTGSSIDPFILTSLDDLELIGTVGYALTAYYKLGSDIDASGTQDPGYNEGAGWLPIPGEFKGNFNGDGYTISGLYINRPTTDKIGLFSQVDSWSGVEDIYDLTLENVNITGRSFVGSVAGYFQHGIINNCNVSGEITALSNNLGGIVGGGEYRYSGNRQILYSIFEGTLNGLSNTGGIAGAYSSHQVIIHQCASSGIINATGDNIGGIAGNIENSIIRNCTVENIDFNLSSSSNNVGGVLGRGCFVTLEDSIFKGNIEAQNRVGGLLGLGDYVNGSTQQLVRNQIEGTISGASMVGGVVGKSIRQIVINTIDINVTVRGTISYIGGIIGQGTGENHISNFRLNNSNLKIETTNSVDNIGGIAGAATSCSLSNIKVEQVPLSGRDFIGGIVGKLESGTFSVKTILRCLYSGNIMGRNYLGGIFGYINQGGASFSLLCSFGNITATGNYIGGLSGFELGTYENCYSRMNISGQQHVGGLIGRLTSGQIIKSYSSGTVTGTSNVGGMVGSKNTATATSSYWDIQTSGQPTSALGTGKTTFELKQPSTFSDWDLDTIWYIEEVKDGFVDLEGAEATVVTGATTIQLTPGETELDGLPGELLMGSGVIGAIGNTILSGLPGTIQVSVTINAPSGEIILSGLAPYLPSEADIKLYDLNPTKLNKKFITYVDFKLKMPDENSFLIEEVAARLNNESIPINIITNGQIVNQCRMEIDTNHLPEGHKKLDINVIITGNSNQFRRYVRIL